MADWTDGGPMSWQVSNADTEPGEPDGYKAVIRPAFRLETFFADFEKWINNLYRCNNWHKCLHADLLDGKHGSEYQSQCDKLDSVCTITDNGFLTFSGDTAAVRNLIAGNGISIDVLDGTADPTFTLGSFDGFTSATVATGDLVAITDIDDSNSIKKVTAQSIADLGGGGDVSGPASSTDNSIPSFDGTGGKTLQDPGVAFLSANGLQLHGTEDTIMINGTSYDVHLIVHDEASLDVSLGLHKHSNTAVHAPVVEFARSRGTEASEAIVADGDDVGRISFLAHDDNDYSQVADILVEVDGTPGNNDTPGRIKFRTTPAGSNTPTLAVTINSDQTVDFASGITLGTDLAITHGGTGASDEDNALKNLISGATNRAGTPGDYVPFYETGSAVGGYLTIQALISQVANLNDLGTIAPATDHLLIDDAGTPVKVDVDDFFTQVINAATNDTSPDRNVEFIARDGSGNLRAVLLDDLAPSGQHYVQNVLSYSGSGSSGKTLTLTGINRAHHIEIFPVTGATAGRYGNPDGATGAFATRYEAGTAVTTAFTSLDAPAAGSDQTLTLTTGDSSVNGSGVTYMVFVVGTPT